MRGCVWVQDFLSVGGWVRDFQQTIFAKFNLNTDSCCQGLRPSLARYSCIGIGYWIGLHSCHIYWKRGTIGIKSSLHPILHIKHIEKQL